MDNNAPPNPPYVSLSLSSNDEAEYWGEGGTGKMGDSARVGLSVIDRTVRGRIKGREKPPLLTPIYC